MADEKRPEGEPFEEGVPAEGAPGADAAAETGSPADGIDEDEAKK